MIRPFLATEEEAAASGVEWKQGLGETKEYKFRIQISPMDCTGCSNCVDVCPAKDKALVMRPLEEQMPQQKNWDYITKNIGYKQVVDKTKSVKNLQFAQPLFEFSGACSGCGETPYVKLISQLFGDREMVSNATGCSSIYSGSIPSTPYTTNDKGKGVAWANSLFEDFCEFGLGMTLAVEKMRERLVKLMNRAIEGDSCPAETKELFAAWIADKDNTERSIELEAQITPIVKANADKCEICKEIASLSQYLIKKSQWIIGGDGASYDIGFGGLDHVLASGKNVNILVLDTEVYSNTGGQASKATPVGAIAKFAAAGKRVRKKDLGLIASTYGYVYCVQVAMGADQAQTLKAIREAEAYDGPSIIIAYAPCINHGLKAGMGKAQAEEAAAVACGYWHLWRYNPELEAEGKNPFTLDSKEPKEEGYQEFLDGKTTDYIKRIFEKEGVRNWDGGTKWQATTLMSMLENEKYKGDALLQKSYTVDFLTKKRTQNKGEIQMFYVEDDHDAIISKRIWECVQLEIKRRKKHLKEHGTNSYSHRTESNPFVSKIICGDCNKAFARKGWRSSTGVDRKVWQCSERYKVKGVMGCANRHVEEETLIKAYLMAWNALVENREDFMEQWTEQLQSENLLEGYRAEKFIEYTDGAEPLTEMDTDFMLKTLDHIKVFEDGTLLVVFLDGTEIECKNEEE